MTFLRICADDLEWGFRVPDNYIPCVGDIVNLWHGLPDEEGEDAVDAVVIKREWGFASDFNRNNSVDIWLWVKLETPLPSGHIPDSTEWPSKKHTQREEHLKKVMEECKSEVPK